MTAEAKLLLHMCLWLSRHPAEFCVATVIVSTKQNDDCVECYACKKPLMCVPNWDDRM